MHEGELVFNTAITGYEEILTDPSYAGQIVTFTFPHIGNVGTNPEDFEATTPVARGMVVRAPVTEPSNWRSTQHLATWLERHGIAAITGVDTRRITRLLRDRGAQNAALAYRTRRPLDLEDLKQRARSWPGLVGMDLAPEVSTRQRYDCARPPVAAEHRLQHGRGRRAAHRGPRLRGEAQHPALASERGCRVTVLPVDAKAEEVLALKPDGVVLANGPGDPAATGSHAVPEIRKLVETGTPVFGICLGHQLLALALGARTEKMPFGHHGANHPVKDLATGKVEITSQNHGFAVADKDLPSSIEVTHRSLFDGTIQGLKARDRPAFSVQYHPEASPGPHDSGYLFDRFLGMVRAAKPR